MKHKYKIHLPFMACVWLLMSCFFLQGCTKTNILDEFPDVEDVDVDKAGEPSDSPNPDNPFVDYQEVLALRIRMQAELERLTQRTRLNYSQFQLIEKNLKELSKNYQVTRSGLEELEQQIKTKIDFVANYRARPTLDIKCKGCKRQMGADMHLLYHLEEKENIFGSGGWLESDDYGNTKPNAGSFQNLKSYFIAHPDFKACWVHTCLFCYRQDEIAHLKQECDREKEQLEADTRERNGVAKKCRNSKAYLENIAVKAAIQEDIVAKYEAAVKTFKNLAKDMERLRASAIVDYEAITYGDTEKYRKRDGEV